MSAQVDTVYTNHIIFQPHKSNSVFIQSSWTHPCYRTFISSPVRLSFCGLLQLMRRDSTTTHNPSVIFKRGFPSEPYLKRLSPLVRDQVKKHTKDILVVLEISCSEQSGRLSNRLIDEPTFPFARVPAVLQTVGLKYFMEDLKKPCVQVHVFFHMVLIKVPLYIQLLKN